jgi:hypothetical protein
MNESETFDELFDTIIEENESLESSVTEMRIALEDKSNKLKHIHMVLKNIMDMNTGSLEDVQEQIIDFVY